MHYFGLLVYKLMTSDNIHSLTHTLHTQLSSPHTHTTHTHTLTLTLARTLHTHTPHNHIHTHTSPHHHITRTHTRTHLQPLYNTHHKHTQTTHTKHTHAHTTITTHTHTHTHTHTLQHISLSHTTPHTTFSQHFLSHTPTPLYTTHTHTHTHTHHTAGQLWGYWLEGRGSGVYDCLLFLSGGAAVDPAWDVCAHRTTIRAMRAVCRHQLYRHTHRETMELAYLQQRKLSSLYRICDMIDNVHHYIQPCKTLASCKINFVFWKKCRLKLYLVSQKYSKKV